MFLPGKPFRPILMYVGMQEGSTLKALHLGRLWTRLEQCTRDQHSSLWQIFINYGRKKFWKNCRFSSFLCNWCKQIHFLIVFRWCYESRQNDIQLNDTHHNITQKARFSIHAVNKRIHSIMTLSDTTINIMTLSIKPLRIKPLRIKPLSIKPLSTMTLNKA